MQQKWDDIDNAILDSFLEVESKENYNSKLLKKIDARKVSKNNISRNRQVAASFICAGFLIMFLYTTSIQYNIVNFQWRIKAQISSIEEDYKLGIFKDILGGWLIWEIEEMDFLHLSLHAFLE